MKSVTLAVVALVSLSACVAPPIADTAGLDLVATGIDHGRSVAEASGLLGAAEIDWTAIRRDGRIEILVEPERHADARSLLALLDGSAVAGSESDSTRIVVEPAAAPIAPPAVGEVYVGVAAYRDSDALADERVWRALAAIGSDAVGISNAGGTSVSVPASQADAARDALRASSWSCTWDEWSRRGERGGYFLVQEERQTHGGSRVEIPPFELPDERVVVAYYVLRDHSVSHPIAAALLAARTDPGSQLVEGSGLLYAVAIDVPRDAAARARRVLQRIPNSSAFAAGVVMRPGSFWVVPELMAHPASRPPMEIVGTVWDDRPAAWNRLYAVVRTSGLNWIGARSEDGAVIWSGPEDADELRRRLRAAGAIEVLAYTKRGPVDFFVVDRRDDPE